MKMTPQATTSPLKRTHSMVRRLRQHTNTSIRCQAVEQWLIAHMSIATAYAVHV